jgi:hypothetical protein
MVRPHALSRPARVAAQASFIVSSRRQAGDQLAGHVDVGCDSHGGDGVGFVPRRSWCAPGHYAMISEEPRRPRPRAVRDDLFVSSPDPQPAGGRPQAGLLRDARGGDITGWRFPGIGNGHDTGQVLIAAGAPGLDDPGMVTLRVNDGASRPCADDTRADSPGQLSSGAGRGLSGFGVHDAGRPASRFASSDRFRSPPTAIGRLDPLPAPQPGLPQQGHCADRAGHSLPGREGR